MYEWDRAVRFVEDRTLFGVTLLDWAIFAGLTLVLFLILRVVVAALRRRLRGHAGKTEHRYDDYALQVLDHTWNASLLAFAAFFALYFVHLEPAAAAAPTPDAAVAAAKAEAGPRPLDNVEHTIRVLALLVIFLQAGRWGMGLIDEGLKQGFRFANFSESASQTAYNVVRFFALAGLWAVVVILILGSFGIEVAPLLATLGVGGIAVGFALQKILADLFCSVAIVLDRPFEAGDFIITGDDMGSVEKIGIKTTRVRSLGGEQIVFPNSDLIGSRIHNYKRMAERRVTFGFGVLYSTAADTLEAIGPAVKEIIEGIDEDPLRPRPLRQLRRLVAQL